MEDRKVAKLRRGITAPWMAYAVFGLVVSLGTFVGCGNRNAEIRRAELAEINEILDYKEATNEYIEYYAIVIQSSFELVKLEGEGTMEHAVEMTRFSLDYITLLHSNFQRVPPPARAETFSSLVRESFEATEAGLTSLHTVFLEASQLTYAKASSDEAFGVRAATGYRQGLDLLQEGLSTLGEAIDESNRLTTELENRMKVLK